jgi:hypothetical protein
MGSYSKSCRKLKQELLKESEMTEEQPQTPAEDKPIEKQVVEKFASEKRFKFEKVEHKEKPEKIEHKEKPEKFEHKEKPEKFEHKEKPEKFEHKEKIEHKELEKPQALEKLVREKDFEVPDPGGPVEERLAALEQSVAGLQHFITSGQRPDLSRGALANEPPDKK